MRRERKLEQSKSNRVQSQLFYRILLVRSVNSAPCALHPPTHLILLLTSKDPAPIYLSGPMTVYHFIRKGCGFWKSLSLIFHPINAFVHTGLILMGSASLKAGFSRNVSWGQLQGLKLWNNSFFNWWQHLVACILLEALSLFYFIA